MDVNLSVLCGQDSLTKGEFYEKKDITIYNIFLIRLIQLSPKLPSIDHKESVFTHSALDKKQPGVLVIHGKPGDKADIELLEGTLYKQVILKSKKEKIRVPAGQYNISLNGGKKLWYSA